MNDAHDKLAIPSARPIAPMLCITLVLAAYAISYAVIRTDCKSSFGNTVVVPSYILSSNGPSTLGKFYKPLFMIESRCTGRYFTWTPWAASGF